MATLGSWYTACFPKSCPTSSDLRSARVNKHHLICICWRFLNLTLSRGLEIVSAQFISDLIPSHWREDYVPLSRSRAHSLTVCHKCVCSRRPPRISIFPWEWISPRSGSRQSLPVFSTPLSFCLDMKGVIFNVFSKKWNVSLINCVHHIHET